MDTGTLGSRIDSWRTKIRGKALLQVGDHQVCTVQDAQEAFAKSIQIHPSCPLLFAYPEIRQDISHNGLQIMPSGDISQATHNQLNNCWDFLMLTPWLQQTHPYDIEESGNVLNYVTCVMHLILTLTPWLQQPFPYDIEDSGNVLNYVTRVMHSTWGKLLKQQDWHNWQDLEFLQQDQYFAQGIFGAPSAVTSDEAVLSLVWIYNIKALDGHKKARCTCDGSTRSGTVCILNKTYANCI